MVRDRCDVGSVQAGSAKEVLEGRRVADATYLQKNLIVRLDDKLAADTEALARAEGQSLNETVKLALREAVERRQKDPAFRRRIRHIIDEDRELLERLAK
ncbi:MAG: ribbon-helix-helix protein, CopG family [Actinobacteria bacterium]|nr:ribbon-helix-helix protein, CopG family [Actinomycetota bacterium]